MCSTACRAQVNVRPTARPAEGAVGGRHLRRAALQRERRRGRRQRALVLADAL